MIWIEAIGGLLLLVASFLVIRAVVAADAVGVAPTTGRRARAAGDLRRAA